jgi:hypothetical protein
MYGDKERPDLDAGFFRDDVRDRAETFDVEALIPNEILAMILALVRPADVPAAARVARRWRDLAPPVEPDVVLAYKDYWSMNLILAPRSKIKQRYLDRLRLEAADAFVCDGDDDNSNCDDDDNGDCDPDDIRDVCTFLGHNKSITLWQLFKNLRHRSSKVEMFAVHINEYRGVVENYWVTRFDTEHDLAAELVDWAHSELAGAGEGSGDDDDTEFAPSFEMLDLESDEGLREMSALVDEACKIVH